MGERVYFKMNGRPWWSLLWAGTLRLRLNRRKNSGCSIEWGPPVLWRPRFRRVTEADGLTNVGWQVGWLWWIYRYARLSPLADTISKERRDG